MSASMQEAVGQAVSDVVCIYGTPTSELTEWLKGEESRHLVVLGPKKESFHHSRIHFILKDDVAAMQAVAWKLVFLSFEYRSETGNENASLALARMARVQEEIFLSASDYKERGLNLLANVLANSQLFARSLDGTKLFGAFSQTPAIICGAGPSLEQAIPSLRELGQDALVFAGGTALASLSTFSLCPHFAGLIDPHEPPKRLFAHQAHEAALFYQSRAHPQPVKQMQGPLLHIPGSENDFFEESRFDVGWNVTTFLVALATHLGCSPIILVGVDLAQEEDKCYAGDFERTEGGELIQTADGLYTRRDWLFAADWLGDFAQKHPEVEWINASNGLEIKGIAKRALSDVVLEKQSDLASHIHQQVQGITPGVLASFDREALCQSFARVAEGAQKMLQLLERIFPEPPEKNGEWILLQHELEHEQAFTGFLRPVWDKWKGVFERELPPHVPEAYGIGLNQWLFMKGICDDARTL